MKPDALFDWMQNGVITIPFHLSREMGSVEKLMLKYADIPMSFADACLVRMAELYPASEIFTLDSDFRIYRKHGRRLIQTIMPEELYSRTQ